MPSLFAAAWLKVGGRVVKVFALALSKSMAESDEVTLVSLLDVFSVDPLDPDRSKNGLLMNGSGDMEREGGLSLWTTGKSNAPRSKGGVALSTIGAKSLVRGDNFGAFLDVLPRPYF